MIKVPPFTRFTPVISRPRRIIFTMASTPSTFGIQRATLRYDKDFAFSFRLDDGWTDAFYTAFPFFNGGDVVHQDGSINDYAGLNYTDGCGNDVKFRCGMAINPSAVELSANPLSRMNWTQINQLYNAGWGMWNHSYSERVQFDVPNPFEGLTQNQIDDIINEEVDLAEQAIRANTGVKCKNFTAPSNDDTYDPVTQARANAGTLKIVNNIYKPQTDAFLRTYQDWFINRIAGIGADYDFSNVASPTITRTATDLDFITNSLASLGVNENRFFAVGSHRVDYSEAQSPSSTDLRFLDLQNFFERLEATYGKSGSDSMLFVPQNDLYEYQLTSELTILDVAIDGSTVTVNCDFSGVDADFREHALSLLVDSDAIINNISFENFDSSSFNIGYSGDNTTALVNAAYSPDYETAVIQRGRAEVFVKTAENTQQQSDFDTAQAFILTLSKGSYQDALQARLDAINVVPDSTVVNIDIGNGITGSTSSNPWNNFTSSVGLTVGSSLSSLLDTTGSPTAHGIEISTDFAALETNVPFNSSQGGLPFPYEACRDSFETPESGQSAFKLTGLDQNLRYDFVLYGSRGFVHDQTIYTATGANSDSATLVTKNNVINTASILNIQPNASGEIVLTVEGNGSNRGYIGVIQYTERNP